MRSLKSLFTQFTNRRSPWTLRAKQAFVPLTAITLALASAVGPALANDVLYSGATPAGTGDFSPAFISTLVVAEDVTVNVNTIDLTGPGLNTVNVNNFGGNTNLNVDVGRTISGATANGVYLSTTTGNITTVNNGSITGPFGVTMDARFAGDGGNVNLSGTGSITGTVGTGAWLLTDIGTVTMNGFSSVTGGTFGVLINSNGTYAGAPGGNVNLGTTTALGPVTATAGSGIWVEQLVNVFGDGNINIVATDVTATGGLGIRSLGWTGANNVTVSGTLNSTSTGIYATTTTGNIVVDGLGTGSVTSSALAGVIADARFLPLGGNVTIQNFTSVNAATVGVWALTDTGTSTVDNIGAINSGTWGILANATGAVNIGQGTPIGPIVAGTNGIEVIQLLDPVNNGEIKINATNITANAGFGIHTLAWGENTTINVAGTLASPLATGVFATSTAGNIVVDGLGTGLVNGGDEGVTAHALGSGNVTVQNFTAVTTTLDTGIWAATTTGNSLVSNVGTITGAGGDGILATALGGNISIQGSGLVGGINGGGRDGIFANAAGGNINIGDVALNGPVTGFDEGMELYTILGGNITVVTDQNVTGTTAGWGIFSSAQAGNINIDVNGGTVSGANRGIEAITTTGNSTIDILAGATVQGPEYGLLTANFGGTSTTNNAGLIRDTTDTGAAGDLGGDAYWHYAGAGVLNNAGQVTGRVHSTGSTSFVMNNQAGGVWTPGTGLNLFNGLADTVNNAGTINVRTGTTTFNLLENFNNQAGGHIDMSYGPGATDNLVVLNFSPQAGSAATFNFNSTGANNSALGFDNSTNGQGTADTIVVAGTATPAATSTVNLVNAGGTPTALAGSVSLIYTGINKVAPTPGAAIANSTFYAFGSGDPTTGAVKFYLVDDGNGGLYLQWAPNLTPASLGGFLGGGLSDSESAPSGINVAAGQVGTIVGGVGIVGGPSGGGAFGRIGDDAANSVLFDSDRCPCGGDCSSGRYTRGWILGTGAGTSYSAGGSGSVFGTAAGVERDLASVSDIPCGRAAVGVFGFGNWSNDRWLTGTANTNGGGVGVYGRAASEYGTYSTILGSLSWADSDLSNRIFGSTAKQTTNGYAVVGALGQVVQLSDMDYLDFRTFASYGNVNGNGFSDSNGLIVSGTGSSLVTVGGLVGLHHRFDANNGVFARSGIKWVQLDRDATVGATTINGNVDLLVGSIQAGYQRQLWENTTFDTSLFGDFGQNFSSGGGNVGLTIRF